MYIKEFCIKNFRSIKDLKLSFNKGVNIIIGENNSGKTAVIDALRICLSYGSLNRDIYVNKDSDFYLDSNNPDNDGKEINFDLIFEPENEIERAVFIDMIKQDTDGIHQTIELHFKYFLEENADRSFLRWRIWGGENEGQQVPIEELQLINHTYLGALRDATEKLRPHAYGNKIANLYRNIKCFNNDEDEEVPLTKEKKQELADTIKKQVEVGEWKSILDKGNKIVKEHIIHSTINGKNPDVEFTFLPYSYNDIVDNIEARKPVYVGNETPVKNQKYFSVKQNGLGENNIIYAGTVLGDLIGQNEIESNEYFYSALLIEEPEAHLHPQKQNTFFKYLSSLKNDSVQLFITSHSPTITAKANLDYVTVLQRQANKISAFTLNNSILNENNKKFLSKFLDVTKSQLFFANGVILVEGISEALLLPVFSKIIDEDIDIEKSGIEIVNINGVAFEHFAKLFNSEDESKRMLARCALLTDDDRGQISKNDFKSETIDDKSAKKIFEVLRDNNIIDDLNRILSTNIEQIDFGEEIDKSAIKSKLRAMQDTFSNRAINAQRMDGGNLIVKLAKITFEYAIMVESKFNLRLLKLVYRKMHPKTKFLPNNVTIEDQIHDILVKLYAKKDKSELAYQLAVLLEQYEHLQKRFEVPKYIKEGINWVAKGEK